MAGLLILAVMQFPGAIAFAFDGALDRGPRRTLAGPSGGDQPARLRPAGDCHAVRAAARPRRAVGCTVGVDDDARLRQLASVGVAAMAAGNGIDASNRAVSRTDEALRPLPAA